jgi:Ran GTPase-activating protein (RanGAP) involved in mRNA processing and transport
LAIQQEQLALQWETNDQLDHLTVALNDQSERELAWFHQQHRLLQVLTGVLSQIVDAIGNCEDKDTEEVLDKDGEDEAEESEGEEDEEVEKEMSEKKKGKQWAK